MEVVLEPKTMAMVRPQTEVAVDSIPLVDIEHIEQVDSSLPGASAGQFIIQTKETGFNLGEEFRLQVGSDAEAGEWVQALREATGQRQEHEQRKMGPYFRVKYFARRMFKKDSVQLMLGVVILVNFAFSMMSAELLPEAGSPEYAMFELAEDLFTYFFTVELAVNMWVNWWEPFLFEMDGSWNVGNMFDVIVIAASWVQIIFRASGGGVTLFRLIRIFRVLRLFKKLHSLRRIIAALSSSVVPMLNAFGVLFLFCAIYAILAVNIFQDRPNNARFQSFSYALFTMFHMCTLDEWSNVVRELADNGVLRLTDTIFFVSFIVLAGIIILNVVVALLLDEFVVRAEKVQQEKADATGEELARVSFLDPLLAQLAGFKSTADLEHRILFLFSKLDVDECGFLDFQSLRAGLHKLNYSPRIDMSEGDFLEVLRGLRRDDVDTETRLGLLEFAELIRQQLVTYIQVTATHGLEGGPTNILLANNVHMLLRVMMMKMDEYHVDVLDTVVPDEVTVGVEASPVTTAVDGRRGASLAEVGQGPLFRRLSASHNIRSTPTSPTIPPLHASAHMRAPSSPAIHAAETRLASNASHAPPPLPPPLALQDRGLGARARPRGRRRRGEGGVVGGAGPGRRARTPLRRAARRHPRRHPRPGVGGEAAGGAGRVLGAAAPPCPRLCPARHALAPFEPAPRGGRRGARVAARP